MRRITVHVVTLLLLLVCQFGQAHHVALPGGMNEVEATWLWCYHTVPASITRDQTDYWYGYAHTDVNKINNPSWTEVAAKHIKPGAKAPVVLVLHDCGGIFRSPIAYRVFFMERGYAVIEPDSFARPGHSCNSHSLNKRTEELAYAYKMIRELPWADQDRIVLMGISQGGFAVAQWNKPGFAAHIILANDCDGDRPLAPPGTPVLAAVGEFDEAIKSSCKITREVKSSRSIVIPGAPHGIMDYPETEQAIEEFLSASGLL